MKLQLVNPISKIKGKRKVIDVNGDERNPKSCRVKLSRNILDETLIKTYIPIIDSKEKPAHLVRGEYIIQFPDGSSSSSKSNSVRWLNSLGIWYKLKRGETFVTVLYENEEGKFVETEGVYDPYITVEAFQNNGNTIYIKDYHTAVKMGYKPSLSSNLFYKDDLKKQTPDMWRQFSRKHSFNLPIKTTHHADDGNECFNRVVEIFESQNYKAQNREVRYFNRLMGGKTFGIEYEAVNGAVPSPMLGVLGLTALTDGSIGRNNYEFTTIPLKGVKGLEAVREQCKHLSKHTEVTSNCALHIHIGNVVNDKITFVALFALMHRLQDEIYAMNPYYKQHEVAVMRKNKEYSRHLPNVGLHRNKIFQSKSSEEFNSRLNAWHKQLFEYFACAEEGQDHNRGGRKDENLRTVWGQKWHCPTRYYWANFINYLFSKTGTVEFRVHEPSTNFTKVTTFLLLCVSLIRYAENNVEKILKYEDKITLDDVVESIRTNFTGKPIGRSFGEYCNSVTDYMHKYIQSREDFFRNQVEMCNTTAANNRNNAFDHLRETTDIWLKTDKDYSFENDGRLNLY